MGRLRQQISDKLPKALKGPRVPNFFHDQLGRQVCLERAYPSSRTDAHEVISMSENYYLRGLALVQARTENTSGVTHLGQRLLAHTVEALGCILCAVQCFLRQYETTRA